MVALTLQYGLVNITNSPAEIGVLSAREVLIVDPLDLIQQARGPSIADHPLGDFVDQQE